MPTSVRDLSSRMIEPFHLWRDMTGRIPSFGTVVSVQLNTRASPQVTEVVRLWNDICVVRDQQLNLTAVKGKSYFSKVIVSATDIALIINYR
ncbi:hypothetical protein B0O99DRAFT_681969 [Bisporella sp. PMI_857]|nr:hypothetical protein B0O99DRAFT_681969 [Bisporella sp. PMI_857]